MADGGAGLARGLLSQMPDKQANACSANETKHNPIATSKSINPPTAHGTL
jgi:hypothetical protein